MATTFGIIYATGSKMHLAVVVPDNDAELNDPAYHKDGTTLSIHNLADYKNYSPAMCAAIIQATTGVAPPIILCARVDANNVVLGIEPCDPVVTPTHAGSNMIKSYSPEIISGCTYSPSTGLFSTPAVGITPGTVIPNVSAGA